MRSLLSPALASPLAPLLRFGMAGMMVGGVLLASNGCGGARPAMSSDASARDSGAADSNEPEADGTDGDTADAGVDGGSDRDRDRDGSCVGVTGGGLAPWRDLQIVGRRFDAYEGRRMRVVVASDVGGRLGVADVAIAGGAFDLTIPGTFNDGAYTELALYVDDDADDACDVGEPLWGFVTGIVQDNLLVEVTPDGPCLRGGGPSMSVGCRSWPSPAGPCVINAQADLTMRLPCPP